MLRILPLPLLILLSAPAIAQLTEGTLVVSRSTAPQLLQIERETGDADVLTEQFAYTAATDVTYSSEHGFVASFGFPDGIVILDPLSEKQVALSVGGLIDNPLRIVMAEDAFLLQGGGRDTVIRVDGDTGEQSIVFERAGTPFVDLAILDEDRLLLITEECSLFTAAIDGGVPVPWFSFPGFDCDSLALPGNGLAYSRGSLAIMEVGLESRSYRVLAPIATFFDYGIRDLAVDEFGIPHVVETGSFGARVVRVDPSDGAVASVAPGEFLPSSPLIALGESFLLAVASSAVPRSVNLATGETRGIGMTSATPGRIDASSPNRTVSLSPALFASGLHAIEFATGVLSQLSLRGYLDFSTDLTVLDEDSVYLLTAAEYERETLKVVEISDGGAQRFLASPPIAGRPTNRLTNAVLPKGPVLVAAGTALEQESAASGQGEDASPLVFATVDPNTGELGVIPLDPESQLEQLMDMAPGPENHVWVLGTSFEDAPIVVAKNLLTGLETPLAVDGGIVDTPCCLGAEEGHLYLLSPTEITLRQIDLATGAQSLVSDDPLLEFSTDLSVVECPEPSAALLAAASVACLAVLQGRRTARQR